MIRPLRPPPVPARPPVRDAATVGIPAIAYQFARRRGLAFTASRDDVREGVAEGDFVRIRPSANVRLKGVTEPYVLRGGFHILANARPSPRVYWHPHFLSRIGGLLGATE